MGLFERFRGRRKTSCSSDEAGLALAILAWTAESPEALESIRRVTPLSDASIRGELLSLRLFALDLGAFLAFGGQTDTQIAVLGAALVVHGFLAGEPEGAKGEDDRRLIAKMHLRVMLDSRLSQLRQQDPRGHHALESLRAVAHAFNVSSSRVQAYKEVVEPDAKRSLQNVGGRFARFCQAEYDPIVQALGAVEFGSMLKAAEDFLASVNLRQAE